MKTLTKLALLLLTILSLNFVSCSKDDNTSDGQDGNTETSLNTTDAEGLIFMREEEKLARDAYIYMYKEWGQQIFKNISGSEQKHMDLLLTRVEQYKLKDNVSQDTGVFNNTDLQNLYNQLIAQGKDSLVAGLIVGATIEEVDIVDLEKYIAATSNDDLKCTYDVLLIGSRNHLRAFVKNMNNNNYNYSPQFLSQDEYDAIINGSHESGHSCD